MGNTARIALNTIIGVLDAVYVCFDVKSQQGNMFSQASVGFLA